MEEELEVIGKRIRQWRDELHLSLHALAPRCDVAPSTIQKIETGQMVPSIAIVMKIARGLGRRPSELISTESHEMDVVFMRAKEHSFAGSAKKIRVERLSGDLFDPAIEMWRVTVGSGYSSGEEPHAYEGEEVVVCEKGRMTFAVAYDEYDLQVGDTLHFKSDLPHRWWNSGDGAACFVIAGSFPRGLRQELHRQIQSPPQKHHSAL